MTINNKFLISLLLLSIVSFKAVAAAKTESVDENTVIKRTVVEKKKTANFFNINFYKQNYLLPFYYTGAPYNQVYIGQTPNGELLNHEEIKYQISVKLPIWKDILHLPTTLYLAYSQLSYWQAYNTEQFFRSTDYEPELFLSNSINYKMPHDILINFVNIGLDHQSNGFGNSLERSWNRAYLNLIASRGSIMVSVKPWYVFHDNTYEKFNPDMTDYLGYVELLAAYKNEYVTVSASTYGYNLHNNHPSAVLSISAPITPAISVFLQVFSGYGQSLIEYNHRTNSAGVGFAFSNWV